MFVKNDPEGRKNCLREEELPACKENKYRTAIISEIKDKFFPSGSFAANTLTLAIGSSIAQAIPIFVSPILTRIYSPNEYGLFTLFISIASIIAVISTGRYEASVVLPAKDEDAIDLVILTILIVVAFSSFIFLSIILLKEPLIALIKNASFSQWLYYIPLFVLLAGTYQSLNYWLIRKKHYAVMSSRSIIQTISTSIVQLSFGFSGLTKLGLFIGTFTGQSVSLGLVGWQIWRGERNKIRQIKYEKLKYRAREYKDFPLYDTPASLMDTAALLSPILFIAYFYGPVEAGFFGLTMRVLTLPSSLLGNAISQVYYNRIAEIRHDRPEELPRYVLRSAKYLALVIIIPVLVLGLVGSELFSFVFGDIWRDAGVFAQIMSVAVGTKFIVSPLSTIMYVSGNIKLGSKWKTIYFISSYVTFFIAGHFPVINFVMIYTFHEIALYLLYYYLICKASNSLS